MPPLLVPDSLNCWERRSVAFIYLWRATPFIAGLFIMLLLDVEMQPQTFHLCIRLEHVEQKRVEADRWICSLGSCFT